MKYFNKKVYLVGFPIFGFFFGRYLDQKETERLTLFRDKSALYGRPLPEGAPPTWP